TEYLSEKEILKLCEVHLQSDNLLEDHCRGLPRIMNKIRKKEGLRTNPRPLVYGLWYRLQQLEVRICRCWSNLVLNS
ncbi:MAG TPA: hypothetical protein PLN83_14000, partial [Syntrophorhabdus sp.]|nr:hypothetical protein [Syntrophorhabdus sp.]